MPSKTVFTEPTPTLTPSVTEMLTPTIIITPEATPSSTVEIPEPSVTIRLVCPTTEWVDCMPGPDMIKPMCDAAFLTWAKANCPGFKGAAL